MKVGIISTFYKNYNYGGKLQAYALTKVLTNMGLEARQIQYSQHRKSTGSGRKLSKLLSSSDYRAAAVQKLTGKVLRRERASWRQRQLAFDCFDAQIPHTEKVYDDQSISQTNRSFDIFICGSDQIWNPMLLKRSYLLPFVETGKRRLSYAASIASRLDAHWQGAFQEALASFDAVSVRELQDQRELQTLLDKPVERALDPTLLLRAEQWDELTVEPEERQPYLFCYFLGYDAAARRCVRTIARRLGLRLVTMPHMMGASGRFYPSDIGFGDRQVYDATPAEFIGYIKDAAIVVTDSFHATVFSLLYQKQFLTLGRREHQEMSRRFEALLPLFGCTERFINGNYDLDKMTHLCEEPIAYNAENTELERMRQASLDYLWRNTHP